MKRVLLALVVALGLTLGTASPAAANPSAGQVCLAERPFGTVSNWSIIYAQWDDLTVSYVRAACWLGWVGPGPGGQSCVGYAYLYANGGTGNGGWDC